MILISLLALTREKLYNNDPYLEGKNHPTLDVIAIATFYVEMSKFH